MSEIAAPLHARLWRPAAATVLLFTLLGPLIGAVALTVLLPIFLALTAPQLDLPGMVGRLPGFTRMLLTAIPASYGEGGVQAFLTGALLSAYGWITGRPNYIGAAILALCTAAGFLIFGPRRDALEGTVMVFVHLIPALACWWIAKNFWPENP